jgi:HSP20 family protein
MANALMRRDPFGSLFDDFFGDFFVRPGLPLARDVPTVARARMDVIDKGDRFQVLVDLPGVKKEDIQVTIEGSRVAITADTKSEKEEKEGERVLHSERYEASYARTFELPVEVTESGAEANFENGVLKLTLPKRATVSSKRLAIN